MANALQENLQQLRSRVQAGPVGAFFRWWFGELKQAMPASWQARLQLAQGNLAEAVSWAEPFEVAMKGAKITAPFDLINEFSMLTLARVC